MFEVVVDGRQVLELYIFVVLLSFVELARFVAFWQS
jgi:hypothetical protein